MFILLPCKALVHIVSLSSMLHLVPFNHHTKFLCSALCRFMYQYRDCDCLCVCCISEMKMFVTHLALYMSQTEMFKPDDCLLVWISVCLCVCERELHESVKALSSATRYFQPCLETSCFPPHFSSPPRPCPHLLPSSTMICVYLHICVHVLSDDKSE